MSFSGTKGHITKPKPGVMLNPLHPLSKGLVGYWLFNEGAGSLTNDISGYGNHGRLTNMVPNVQDSGWGGSKFGGGLSFDGSNDLIAINDGDFLGFEGSDESFTLCAYVNIQDLAKHQGIFYKGDANNDFWRMHFWEDNKIICSLNAIDFSSATGIFTTTGWYYVVGVFDKNGNGQVYINGLKSGNPVALNNEVLDINSQILYIGSDITGIGFHLDGSVDFIYIYNRALSVKEIKTLYQNPFCNLLQVPIRRYSVVPPVGAIISTPICRTANILSENRIITILNENRIATVPLENRTVITTCH